MQKITIISSLLLVGFLLIRCTTDNTQASKELAENKVSHEEQVKRGAYLVRIMLCNDCHSPKIMTDQGPQTDPKLMLSGHPSDEKLPPFTDPTVAQNYALFSGGSTAVIGPWGTSFAANLTPDDTGLGNWTINNFKKAIREGKLKGLDGSRDLLPPMPWQEIRHATDEDLEAIFAFLQSIPPVKNVVPRPIPPAPAISLN